MPELPEVETYRRYFEKHAIGKKVKGAIVRDPRILDLPTPTALASALEGRTFRAVRRHGKHLFAETGRPPSLHLHFGMTGDLHAYGAEEPEPRFAKVVLDFGRTRLAFMDARLFGFVSLAESLEAYVAERGLGLDALDPKLTPRAFAALLEGRSGAIKSQLMSQEVVAGLGNLYVDELLFQSSVHPLAPSNSLQRAELEEMARTMKRILNRIIRIHGREADYPRDYLISHREEGGMCPKCGGEIARSTVFGRTTYFCRDHQRPPGRSKRKR
jgi:formamidopyrimidine-DNA glycosylase